MSKAACISRAQALLKYEPSTTIINKYSGILRPSEASMTLSSIWDSYLREEDKKNA